jgi:hypothetical protein
MPKVSLFGSEAATLAVRHMRRVRRLIEIDPSEPRYVQTMWGRGYVLVPHGELGAAERGALVAPGV